MQCICKRLRKSRKHLLPSDKAVLQKTMQDLVLHNIDNMHFLKREKEKKSYTGEWTGYGYGWPFLVIVACYNVTERPKG